MDPNWIIGALAILTIGGVLAISIFHYGVYLKDPKNLEAAKRVTEDRESATTRVSAEGANGRTLRQRLDAAPSVNDRLSDRRLGLNPLDAVLSTKWSEIRATLKGNDS